MKAWSIPGNSQRLDGGAMFGNAPRALWKRWLAPDELNRIPLACRALLVQEDGPRGEHGGRTILFETGIGAFFPPKLRDRFGVVEAEHVLLANLQAAGIPHDRIDVVVLSHLHFDHAGGLLSAYEDGAEPQLLFPNARFVVGKRAWERAIAPHPRDRASFIKELQPLLLATDRLEIVAGARSETLGPAYRLHESDGHTPGLLLTEIPTAAGPLLFCGDLIPGAPWVHLPITMGYDRFPELLIDEKRTILSELITRGGRLFFTHDPAVAMASIGRDERGRFRAENPVSALHGVELS